MPSVKLLGIVLVVQVVLGLTLVARVATDNVPFTGDGEADGSPGRPAAVHTDRFDGAAAFRLLRRQVEMGPRPAGSPESRRLARLLKRIVPRGRYQRVPDGLRNVIGTVRGREPGYVVVGAHYDTAAIRGFVGANDGASGTAVVAELARTIRRPRHTVHFIFFDGEELPRGSQGDFEEEALRGSKVAAPAFAEAHAMVLLDFVGDRGSASSARPTRILPSGGSCGRRRGAWGPSAYFPRDSRAPSPTTTSPSSSRASRPST